MLNDSDKGAKIAAAGGAATGGIVAIGAIASSGSVAGLSAAGITSGLAAVGSIVGGGMAAGLVVTAVAPLVVGASVYGLYKLKKHTSLNQAVSMDVVKMRLKQATSFIKSK